MSASAPIRDLLRDRLRDDSIVFSLTFVMVQFSVSAYSPRLLLWIARDPVMSLLFYPQ